MNTRENDFVSCTSRWTAIPALAQYCEARGVEMAHLASLGSNVGGASKDICGIEERRGTRAAGRLAVFS